MPIPQHSLLSPIIMSDPVLRTGIYNITCPILQEGSFVGRNTREDRSLRPKGIVSLPPGGQPAAWNVEQLEGGRYKLSIGGAPTGVINNALYAFLLGEPYEEWIITYRPNHRAYTIEKEDMRAGWVMPSEDDYTQIAVRPLIVGPSFPPFFPPTELWKFDRVLMD
ncbi:hypothetical protein BV22DRAFT_1037609 [Leucogyrophana mollusca]|uniref:Uncharacterized protein n=1 Tax=Leucogyrophana mollusca TaxID=85980 RepID=A0ACB8B9H4_9AGAM|nr:hypothetical protein BV22DRAFT_1037609 [Leucogyrophana mollusca]